MKKHSFLLWVSAACILLAFVLGIRVGSTPRAPVTITQVSQQIPASPETYSLLVNINTASAQELTVLPGIGEAYAGNIVAYREEHGGFSSVTELLNVEGIGQNRLEAILDYITVGGIP